MSEQQLQVAVIDPIEQEKKTVAWGKFGAQLYKTDITLQLQAQEISSKLISDITPENIKQAEEAVALVTKETKELAERRVSVTNKFTPVIDRLIGHEKGLFKAIEQSKAAILKAKQDVKEAERTKEAKEKELKQVAEIVRVYVADMHASYLNAQLKLLSDGYKYAIEKAFTGEAFQLFLTQLKNRVNLNNRITPPPKPIAQYNTQADIDAEVTKHFNPWPAQKYVEGFAADVDLKFTDWEQALKNKAVALELDAQEVAVTTAAITEQKDKETVAAKLDALAVPLTEGADIKPLKEFWAINEPQTIDEMFNIINAFAVNRALVQENIGRIKPANLGIKQMIAALVAVKDEDPAFECTGITFIKKEKL